MSAVGARSLTAVIRKLLDFLFYAAIVASLLSVAALVAGPTTGLVELSWSPTAHFRFAPSSQALSAAGQTEVRASLEEGTAEVHITGDDRARTAIGLLFCLSMLGAAAFVLHQLRRIFSAIEAGNPFDRPNARRIRWIGMAVVLAELLRASFFFVESSRVESTYASPLVEFHAAFELEVGAILGGLILLVIAEVFRLGTEMKEEQDLTV